MRVLWLLVAFRNMREVDLFVDHLDQIRTGGAEFIYAICDNSPEGPTASRHGGRDDVVLTSRPDNPGYLDGGLAAMAAAGSAVWEPCDWVVLSNTDLVFRTGDPTSVLQTYDASSATVLGPRITEGATSVEKNPHVFARRSVRRLWANWLLTSTTTSTMAYQTVAAGRLRFGQGEAGVRSDASSWERLHPRGERFYAPYGAIIFFSHDFFEVTGLPRGVPLLAEEYFIAETARDSGTPVFYESRIHVHHSAHTTTGPKITARRARGTSRAFRAIYHHARSRLT